MREKTHDDRLKLADAIRGAQAGAADRGDVAMDAKEADLARIEILADDLRPVFEDVPIDDLQWDFAISKGGQPRLWIDATSHVMMARDRRTYRFVRDTRLGRIVVAESPEIRPIADAVTNYIAERIVERQRLMEGQRVSLLPVEPLKEADFPAKSLVHAAPQRSRLSAFITATFWFLIGASAGAGALLLLFWEHLAPFIKPD
ncbi:hypothetical protein [Phyllobacterium zundukense]|uniref:Uncharacterized protein n=1 Tax=Phyllobacterium zundukense TaxID=1867719 RepID=A0A2N9VZG3_9HYPH|nr:hypothetical protein [Phyllobacterium zundukense]ATU90866.1 hypothetical protein BLM14_03865 [Phyllobacterium zundukense]PIO44881.1 hypothetical protein B5P45_10955 [Phyllobacterium zundukense]